MKIGILDQFFTLFKMVTVSRPFGIPLASYGLPVVSIMLKLGKNMAGVHTQRVPGSNLKLQFGFQRANEIISRNNITEEYYVNLICPVL